MPDSLAVTANEDSGRESSADPLDSIPRPRPQSRSASYIPEVVIPSSRSRSTPKSSNSTSPANIQSRGRGGSGSGSRGRKRGSHSKSQSKSKSRSKSPIKRNPNTVAASTDTDIDLDDMVVEPHDTARGSDQEEEGDGVTVKRRTLDEYEVLGTTTPAWETVVEDTNEVHEEQTEDSVRPGDESEEINATTLDVPGDNETDFSAQAGDQEPADYSQTSQIPTSPIAGNLDVLRPSEGTIEDAVSDTDVTATNFELPQTALTGPIQAATSPDHQAIPMELLAESTEVGSKEPKDLVMADVAEQEDGSENEDRPETDAQAGDPIEAVKEAVKAEGLQGGLGSAEGNREEDDRPTESASSQAALESHAAVATTEGDSAAVTEGQVDVDQQPTFEGETPDQADKMDIDEGITSTTEVAANENDVEQEVVSEGEMELDDLPQDAEGEAGGEEATPDAPASSPTVEETSVPTPAPAPSSPAVSTPASQSSVSKPAKKTKKKADSTSTSTKGKKASTSTSGASGTGKKGTGKGKGQTKVEELKAASKASSSVFSEPSQPTTPTRPTPSYDSPNPSPDKNAVYCVCRKPYNEEDDDVLMVGCESCDNWFHPACVGLTEDMVEALDVYICKSCERSTHQYTIYKQLCKREGCSKSLAGKTSKFCSPSCAFLHSQSLIAAISNKNTLKQLAKTFISFPQPKLGVTIQHHDQANKATGKSESGSTNSDRMKDLENQLRKVDEAMTLVLKRQKILEAAAQRAEGMGPLANLPEEQEEEIEDTRKKGKKKKSNGTTGGSVKDDRPCGWSRELILGDDEVLRHEEEYGHVMAQQAVNGGEDIPMDNGPHVGDACMRGKRRCDRHQGWQKTIGVQLEVELSSLTTGFHENSFFENGVRQADALL
uniref:PHD-type domain-containing protein n=1 Tax=Kwoniella dejecticola CBS 10117 TaxID=1296121 RepID=A0A1A6A170_9TREE|nr:uncharacterized protein I303_06075 [Kwoniella dejecticola CBS 10117]OBR83792.1 hypothetical protein I303_06075 [Kwoniella dejecticola CBS 10117]